MTAPRRFARSELATFLRAVDDLLEQPAQIVVIGGGALALGYDVDVGTQDIDTYKSDLALINDAAQRARAATGLKIPISAVTVADFPWNFRDRLTRALPDLRRLDVQVLEKHDLALSKVIRGDDHDFQQLLSLHETVGLHFGTLLERYIEEMGHEVAHPGRVRLNLLELVEHLFGELARVEAERQLARATPE